MARQPDLRTAEAIAAGNGMDLVVLAQPGLYVMSRLRAYPDAISY